LSDCDAKSSEVIQACHLAAQTTVLAMNSEGAAGFSIRGRTTRSSGDRVNCYGFIAGDAGGGSTFRRRRLPAVAATKVKAAAHGAAHPASHAAAHTLTPLPLMPLIYMSG
jgi:hypothetical protein